MEDSSRTPLDDHHRRTSDRTGAHRFFRFDPTVSSGTLLTLATMLLGAAVAYGGYREDRATTKADIELVKLTAERDRSDAKAAVNDFRADVKDMKTDLREVNTKLVELKAQGLAAASAKR